MCVVTLNRNENLVVLIEPNSNPPLTNEPFHFFTMTDSTKIKSRRNPIPPKVRTCQPVGKVKKLYLKMRHERGRRYDYTSTKEALPYYQTSTYQTQCFQLLCSEFPFLKSSGVSMHLERCNGRYYLCHSRICQALKAGIDDDEEQLKVLESVMKGKSELSPAQIQALSIGRPSLRSLTWLQRWNPLQIKTTHKKFPKKEEVVNEYPELTDPILLDEVEFTQQEMDDWKAQIHNRQQRRLEREQAVKEGTTLECMCCYADCAMEEMISCRDQGHLFCVDCLRKHTEDRIFGLSDFGGANGFEITCIHVGALQISCYASYF